MKKYVILTILLLMFMSFNVGADNIYTPISDGLDFEKVNEKKNKSQSNEIFSSKKITNDEIIAYAGEPVKISKEYYRLSNIKAKYRMMRYDTYNHRPKGVVVHATAGGPKDNIDNEITYMNRNWHNAFVHQFNDDKEIVEIHNPHYSAWGAGPIANKYYIHTELVETKETKVFMKSINNQAYYVAYKLREFNLKPSRAKKDKSGSVWFHSEVTKYLGGTDHSDPTGYYKKHGYSLAKFYSLVVYHYNRIDSFYSKQTNKEYYDSGKIKHSKTLLYYNDIVVEKKIKNYDSKGNITSYLIYCYDLKGKKLVYHKKSYRKNNKKIYYEKKTFKPSKNLINHDKIYYNKYDVVYKKIKRKYYSSGKIKNYSNYTYKTKVKNKKYYALNSFLEKRVYSNTGKRLNVKKYYYNSMGKLKKYKKSKAKRQEYIYKKGELSHRKTRYYTNTGKLAIKTYYKYYK